MIGGYNEVIDRTEFPLHWQMTPCERFALTGILEKKRPALALEIGTYRGGSLQVLAKFSQSVISIDIDPTVRANLEDKFPNVSFRNGNSETIVPEVVKELNAAGTSVEFVLIDGDHSATGVQRDIEAVLGLNPNREMTILMHDSFNPHCRRGMCSVRWEDFPHVKFVELDFIPGIYHYEPYDTAESRSMWGGFACAVVSPEVRRAPLVIRESQGALHEAVRRDSRYRFEGRNRVVAMIERGWEKVVRAVS